MKFAELRDRVILQILQTVDDNAGGSEGTWVDVRTVWAKISPMKGRRQDEFSQIFNNRPYEIAIRYNAIDEVDNIQQYRLIRGTQAFRFHTIINEDDRDGIMIIVAESGRPIDAVSKTFEATVIDANNPASPVTLNVDDEYTCIVADISGLTCQQLNDGLVQAQRQKIQRVNLLRTGQTASTNTDDDGDQEKGRLAAFLTLDCNNSFGNTDRFTDSVGGQVYGAGNGSIPDYMIDHAAGLGWQFDAGFTAFGTDDYPDALTAAAAHDNGTFSNFDLPNWNELASLVNCGAATSLLNYAPINNTTSLLMISNTNFPRDTSKVLFFSNLGGFGARNKTSLSSYIYVRNHF